MILLDVTFKVVSTGTAFCFVSVPPNKKIRFFICPQAAKHFIFAAKPKDSPFKSLDEVVVNHSLLMRYKYIVSLILASFSFSLVVSSQPVREPSQRPADWTRATEPFRIAGNLYYVGTYDLACYLITTKDGHILINTGLASSGTMIQASLQKLGFRYKDIKILLTTQAHYDHLGAMTDIRAATHAKLMANSAELGVLSDGGRSDYEMGGDTSAFKPVKVDRLLHDMDTVSLGGTHLVMLHHPGHTKGSSSFLVDIKDGQKTWRVLIANMPTIINDRRFSEVQTYPEIAADFGRTISAMKGLQFDLWVASHASQFNMHEKHHAGDAYRPQAFADRKGYDEYMAELEENYSKKLSEEKK